MKYKYIFAVLTYRNTTDVVDLLESLREKVTDYKVVIVNNFYDDATEQSIKETARKYGCDFISSENNGYSAGNHTAIRHAQANYDFDYIIVSNPDIVVKEFPTALLDSAPYGVIAPQIRARSGKNQNPMVVKDSPLANKMIFEGIRDSSQVKFNIGRAVNKLCSISGRLSNKLSKQTFFRIHQAHGSFMLIPRKVLDEIGMPFDENLFLFAEEGVLAWKLKEKNIPVYYCDDILVHHKEDGSMQFRNDIDGFLKEANLYYYKNYYYKK